MKTPDQTPSAITRDCTNFKNYLKNQFEVENFGEFICTYTFPFEEIEALRNAAIQAGKQPISLRIYYGCNADGTGHKLHISLLDNQGEIIADSGTQQNAITATNESDSSLGQVSGVHGFMAAAALDEERKCPPGGTSDRFIQSLFA